MINDFGQSRDAFQLQVNEPVGGACSGILPEAREEWIGSATMNWNASRHLLIASRIEVRNGGADQ